MTLGELALGWLPAVLPSDARRFRVAEGTLRAALADAGAELVAAEPDVEIASAAGDVRGDARLAIVAVGHAPPAAGPLAVRVGSRLAASLRTRAEAQAARRRLRRRGYEDTSVLLWDPRQRLRLPGLPAFDPSLAERLPQHALVIGRRGPTRATVLEAALAAAGAEGVRWVSPRIGLVLAGSDAGILRIAIGPGRSQIQHQATALDALHPAGHDPVVNNRIPWLLARGREGLADWSLERLLPGARPPVALTPRLLEDCVEFLVALRRVPGGDEGGYRLGELAETAASVCRPDGAAAVRALGERLEDELAGLPRCFAHGDFFAGNLLAEGDRLTGVLDWDAGGPGRPPLIDLLHLQLTRVHRWSEDESWGRAVLDVLLEPAREGGDPLVQRYRRETGLDVDGQVLEALVLAYWLHYVAYQIRAHPHRRSDPAWIEGNVELVLRESGA